MGRRNADEVQRRMAERWPVVQRWDVTYYRRHPCVLLRGGSVPTTDDYTGIDEARCIELVAQRELPGTTMGDLCMGRGLVGLAAHAAGRPFVGTELNKRRLACLLDSLAKRGAPVELHSRP
jgi:methylase of polypeptide subunit release factors